MILEVKMRVDTNNNVSSDQALAILKSMEYHIYKTLSVPESIEFVRVISIQDPDRKESEEKCSSQK
jgi:hypothetical protein